MKRSVAAATTAVLVLSLAFVGLSAGATAATLDEPSASPSAAACVKSPNFAYTFDAKTFSGTITASKTGVAPGTPLCKPLLVRSVSWAYVLPVTAANPSYPQNFDAKSDTQLAEIGSISYQAPNANGGCRQHDIYATFGDISTLATPSALTGPGKPFEPSMLSSVLYGKGPGPTYGHDSSSRCLSLVESDSVAAPTFSEACGAASDLVNYPTLADRDRYTFATSDRRSRGVGTVTVVAVAKTGYTFAPGVTTSWSHNFVSDTTLGCVVATPPVVTPQVCNAAEDAQNAVLPGTISIPATAGLQYTIHPVSPAGSDISVTGSTTDVAPGTYTVSAIALAGHTVSGPQSFAVTVADQAVNCQLVTHALFPADVVASSQSCSNGSMVPGFITVNTFAGRVAYSVGGVRLTAATTPFKPGSYEVLASAVNAGDSVEVPNPVTVTVTGLATSCALTRVSAVGDTTIIADPTLAATGFNGGGMFLGLAGLMILAGIALIVSAVVSSGKFAAQKIRSKA